MQKQSFNNLCKSFPTGYVQASSQFELSTSVRVNVDDWGMSRGMSPRVWRSRQLLSFSPYISHTYLAQCMTACTNPAAERQ